MKYEAKKVVYMLVTADVYELPIACFDTVFGQERKLRVEGDNERLDGARDGLQAR